MMAKPSKVAQRRRAKEILRRLKAAYPDARCGLNFRNPFELLVASILSAQCTDARVNSVTPGLFSAYPTPADFAKAHPKALEAQIHSCGFYHMKAKHIIEACRRICAHFGGQVPMSFEDLLSLPGVGRKTANIILNDGFGIPAIAVDTHVHRLSHRLGFASARDPNRVELKLREVIPKEEWPKFNHLLTFHGRRVCEARRPKCGSCPVERLCPWEGKKRFLSADEFRKGRSAFSGEPGTRGSAARRKKGRD